MFEQPLSVIRKSDHRLNPSLEAPRLPEPWDKRFGASISKIASHSLRADAIDLPAPDCYVVDKNSTADYMTYAAGENLPPTLFGNIVEFLVAYLTVGKHAAEDPLYFRQACDHIDDLYFPDPNHPKDMNKLSPYYKRKNPAHRMDWDELTKERQQLVIDNLIRLSDLMNEVDEACERGLNQKGDITKVSQFVSFHHSLHGGRKNYSGGDNTNIPSVACERQIYRLVMRSVEWFDRTVVQAYQFSFPIAMLKSVTNGVNGGRLDFVANNIIIDLKTNKKKISDSDKLQALLYLAFVQRVNTKKPVLTSCILDARNNKIHAYHWDKLPEKTKRQLNALINFLGWANLQEYEQTDEEKEINARVREEVKALIDRID